jgi:DNA invertase Pin-like site-specific DNA recombinase
MERLGEAGAGFRSLTEAIDTTTPAGRMMMQMVGAFAEFERAMLRKMVSKGSKSAADAARLFKVHPATVSRLLARAYAK